jgi:biopolymer transport protein ExbD
MKRFDQINVIPFVDIMLVLLAIVLTSASFIVQGKIPLDLPTASSAESQMDQPPHRIAINKEGQYFLDDQSSSLEQINTQAETWAKETPIHISVDKQTNFDGFIQLLDVLRQHQLKQLNIETLKK